MNDRRALIISVIISCILGIFSGAGFSIDRYGELRPDVFGILIFILVWSIGSVILYFYLIKRDRISEYIGRRKTVRLPFSVTWMMILAGWIPVLLAEFPGFFVYDATDEYVSVATRVFTTHHPLLHTIVLGGSVYGAEVYFGSANIGIAVYIIVQMILLSALFAWAVRRQTCFCLTSALYYALFPTVVMFALCSVKDTVFSAALFCAVILTAELFGSDGFAKEREEGRHNYTVLVMLGAALTVMMLMRNNGVYACIVYAVVCLCVCMTTHRKALVMLPVLCALAAFLIINTGLKAVTGADGSPKEHQEILTVPIQQLARTYSAYSDTWTDEERELLYRYLPEEGLVHYTPCLSDPVKMYFDNAAYEEDSAGFWRIWSDQFKKHPAAYVNAWLNTSYGYFYPPAVVNVYEGHTVYTFTYTESSYFGYEVEYPGERHSLIPPVDRFYRWLSLDDDIQRIPVISLMFSMAFLVWICICKMGVLIYRKDYGTFAAFALPASVMCTLMLGPTYLPRYTVFLWFILPVLSRRFEHA